MIHTIDQLMSALQRNKEESQDKGSTQVLVRQGVTLYNLAKAHLVWGHSPNKRQDKMPICALVTSPYFRGEVLIIDDVITAVDAIKEQSTDKGNTYVVVNHGDFMVDLGAVECQMCSAHRFSMHIIPVRNLPHPVGPHTHTVCVLVIAEEHKEVAREVFKQFAEDLTSNLQQDTIRLMLKAYDALTPDEVAKLALTPLSLPRAIGMIVAKQATDNAFAVESIRSLVPRIKRTLNRRIW